MTAPLILPYLESEGVGSFAPYIPLELSNRGQSQKVVALLDSGAALNVLPFPVGLQLGADWDEQNVDLTLGGNLAGVEAQGIVLTAMLDQFDPVRLAFAWTKSASVPVLLRQVNFFQEFDVCFFRSRKSVEIRPRP